MAPSLAPQLPFWVQPLRRVCGLKEIAAQHRGMQPGARALTSVAVRSDVIEVAGAGQQGAAEQEGSGHRKDGADEQSGSQDFSPGSRWQDQGPS